MTRPRPSSLSTSWVTVGWASASVAASSVIRRGPSVRVARTPASVRESSWAPLRISRRVSRWARPSRVDGDQVDRLGAARRGVERRSYRETMQSGGLGRAGVAAAAPLGRRPARRRSQADQATITAPA